MLPDEFLDALAQPQLDTWVMPICCLTTGAIVAYEALTRGPLESPFHYPDAIFEQARRLGVISSIDRRCIECSLKLDEQLHSGLTLFLNVFPDTLLEPDFVEWFGELAAPLLKDGRRICLEIHEDLTDQQIHLLAPIVFSLHCQGILVALDDLNPQNLNPLYWALEPDYIKVDRTVVQNLTKEETAAFLRDISQRSPFSSILCEGIECESHLELLQHLDVPLGQGFFFGCPSAYEGSSEELPRLAVGW
ncbi:MAG: EAL domain-containing protein [Sumerlaeia bacterium]